MLWRETARVVLHKMGGLALLRWKHRADGRILMFHAFSESCCAQLDSLCGYLSRQFDPVPLSRITDAIEGRACIPENAVTVTVDDGYKNFLEHGYPIFRKYRIPVTVYAVSGFTEGRLWLWSDQIEFGLEHTARASLRVSLGGKTFELPLGCLKERAAAWEILTEGLKDVPNEERLDFLDGFGELCDVKIPPEAPAYRAPLSWEDLRALAAEGVEIGCHTDSHPILSQISDPRELDREVRGCRKLMEERLGFPVRHFCYPNGRSVDIGETAERAVRDAGFVSATTTIAGMNGKGSLSMQLHRVPFDPNVNLRYGAELLAGLHM
jgi:peptidoglycan/xylan/chitin deacetylase (PgdA/CDA1 family)